jgi:hypothetical protein
MVQTKDYGFECEQCGLCADNTSFHSVNCCMECYRKIRCFYNLGTAFSNPHVCKRCLDEHRKNNSGKSNILIQKWMYHRLKLTEHELILLYDYHVVPLFVNFVDNVTYM